MSEPLDEFLRRKQNEGQGRARVMVDAGGKISPEEAARRLRYRRVYGVDPPEGAAPLTGFPTLDPETRAMLADTSNNPRLQQWLARSPEHAAASRGSERNLGDISDAVGKAGEPKGKSFLDNAMLFGYDLYRWIGNGRGTPSAVQAAIDSNEVTLPNIRRAGAAGVAGIAAGFAGSVEALSELEQKYSPSAMANRALFGDSPNMLAKRARERRQAWEQAAFEIRPKTQSNEAGAVLSGVESVPLSLAALLGGAYSKSATLAASLMGVTVGGQSYGRARDFGLSVEQSALYGAIDAGIEIGTERLTFLKALDVGTPFAKRFGRTLVAEGAGEQLATFGQDFNAWANIEANQGKTFGDFLAERPEAAYQTAIATLVTTGAITGAVGGMEYAANKMGRTLARAAQTEDNRQFAENLGRLAQANAVLTRDRGTFEEFVRSAAEGTEATDVYVDAEQLLTVLDQSALTVEEVFDATGFTPEQLEEMAERGEDVSLPIEQYAARIAPTPLGEKLLDHLRLQPDQMSAEEAKVFLQSAKETFAAEAEQGAILTEAQNTRLTSRAQVEGAVLADLQRARRFTDDVNEVYASVVGAFFDTTAQRLGTTADELFKQYTLRVQSDEVAEASYDQTVGGPLVNIGLDIPTGGTLDPQQVRDALTAMGLTISAENIAQSDTEQTFIGQLDRALTPEEATALSEQLGQEAIAQFADGQGGLFGPQAANWGEFNPAFFLDLAGERLSSGDLFPGYAAQHRIARFQKWFGDSAVRNPDGSPKQVYHATANDFEAFRAQGKGFASALGMAFEVDRNGVFFAEDPAFANEFAKDSQGRVKEGARVIPAYLSIQNPVDLTEEGVGRMRSDPDEVARWEAEGLSLYGLFLRYEHDRWEEFDGEEGAAFVEKMKRLGYDGAFMRERTEEAARGEVWVAFDPEQIKSVNNYGAFNPDDARILHQSAVPLEERIPGYSHVAAYLNPDERALLRARTAQTMMDIFTQMPDAEEMAAVAFSGRAKRGWYERSAQALVQVFGVEDAPRFAALLAALSPQTSVEVNAVNALATWVNWERAGRPTDRDEIVRILGESVMGDKGVGSVLNNWIDNSLRALTAERPSALDLSGPKVNSFMLNLVGVMDEVTNDTWMANYALLSQTIFQGRRDPKTGLGRKSPGYLAMNAVVRRAAEIATERTGELWTPAEIQETVWSWAKALTEKTAGSDRSAVEILQMGGLTEADIDAQPDFASLFVAGAFKRFLVGEGYGKEIAALERDQQLARSERGAGRPTSSEGYSIDPDAFAEHLANAARRIDTRLDRRKSKRDTRQGNLFDPVPITYNQDPVPNPLHEFKRESFYPTEAVIHEDGTVYAAGVPNDIFFERRYASIAEKLGAKAVVPVAANAKELRQGRPLWHTRPPLNPDGTYTLHHWGASADITRTDPTRWGESGTLPPSERQSMQDSLPRTYFGIASGQPGGYVIEFPGRPQFEARVPADKLYDIRNDPDGFKPLPGVPALERKIKEAGYLGYWTQDNQLGLVAVVFEPLDVQPAGAQTMFQDAIFYSALERTLERTATQRASAQQWEATLRKTPGIKEEELQWTGLLEFLQMQDGPITRDQLLEVVRGAGIRVDEVVLGGPATSDTLDEEGYVSDGTQFANWTTDPQNETYRELLITLPVGEGRNPNRAPSTHWDTDGVIAHARFMDKEGPNGERILFVEEVQSDWHQKGRDQGYEAQADPAVLAALRQKLDDAIAAHRAAVDAHNDEMLLSLAEDQPNEARDRAVEQASLAASDARSRMNLAQRELHVAESAAARGIPNAPFRTDWPALVMKRMIRWASEHGYDQIAWTTGEQQAERYNLSQAVEQLRFDGMQDSEGFRIEMAQNAASVLEANGLGRSTDEYRSGLNILRMTEGQMREAFGNDIAQRLIESDGVRPLEGTDLRVGGEGMKAFYDRNLVNITNKLVKKYGAKVGVKAVVDRGLVEQRDADVRLRTLEQMRDRDRINVLRATLTTAVEVEDENAQRMLQRDLDAALRDFETANRDIEQLEKADWLNTQQWGFDITPELKDAAMGGFPLFQRERAARGQIAFMPDITSAPSTITLLRGADLSTFVHELGHFFFEVTNHIASQPGAPAEIVRDRDTMLRYLGVESVTEWENRTPAQRREGHERMARSFEAFLFEGRAPSLDLRSLFGKLRNWMRQVYNTIAQLDVELTDEVRGAFTRMLASDEAIAEAEADMELLPLFMDKPAEMSDADWAAYQRMNEDAKAEAAVQLEARSLRDMRFAGRAVSREIKRLQKQVAEQRAAVREEVEAEINAEPTYRAISFFRTGKIDGEVFDGEHKLNTEMVRELLQLEDAPLPDALKGMTKAGGLNPEQAAELFGFTSADHLLKDILFASPRKDAIEAETDARMRERYGDLNTPEEVEEAARAAVHNDIRGRFVATELAALQKAPGKQRALAAAAKRLAEDMISRLRVRDIRPGQYEAAERRAAKAAREAGAQALDDAVRFKRNQLFNFHAAKAAHTARSEMREARDYLTKFGKTSTRKNIDQSFLDQIDQLLERYELRMISNAEADRRKSLAAWIEEQTAAGFEPMIDQETLDQIGRKNWRDLTVGEMRGLVDAIRNIEHIGRLTKKLLTAKDKADLDTAAGEMGQAVRDNAYKTVDEIVGAKTWWERVQSGARDYFAMHRKMANMVFTFDGNRYGGVFWERFIRPMNERGDWQAERVEQANMRLVEAFKLLGKENTTKRVYVPEVGRSLSLEDRLMIALNWGNSANRQRLLDGDKWTVEQVEAILAPLQANHWDFVERVWKEIDAFWPEIEAKELRVSGVAPEKVEAEPFQTEIDGRLRLLSGGYFPIKYDPDRSSRAEADTEAEVLRQMTRGLYTRATTRRGHTKARAEKVDRPVLKNFSVIFGHVNQVIHDLAWHEYLIDANRLLRHPAVDSAIREHYGPETLRWLRKGLEDVATGDVVAQSSFDQAINYLRNGVTTASMAWSVWTSLLQPVGLTQSMARIGTKHVAKGIASLFGSSPKAMNAKLKWLYETSPFMRQRGDTMQREINEIRNRIASKSPLRRAFERVVPGGVTSAIGDSYFYLIYKAQLMADVPTWLGQYEKSVSEGVDLDTAARIADQAVIDSQSSGMIKDLAGIQRGSPLLKLWTNFYSYFSGTFNLMVDRTAEMKRVGPRDLPYFAVDMMLLTVVPATLTSLMYTFLRTDEDDPEEILRTVAVDNVTYLFGTMIGLREIAAAFSGTTGYQGPAGARAFAEFARLGKQVQQGEADEAAARAANSTAGILLHYPSAQLDRTVRGTISYWNGEGGPEQVFMGPPVER